MPLLLLPVRQLSQNSFTARARTVNITLRRTTTTTGRLLSLPTKYTLLTIITLETNWTVIENVNNSEQRSTDKN
jgi:hypothetical protein